MYKKYSIPITFVYTVLFSVFGLPFGAHATAEYTEADALFTLEAISDGERYGANIVLANLNNDGFDDLVVAAPYADSGFMATDVGALYVYLGTSEGLNQDSTPDTTLLGVLNGQNLGYEAPQMVACNINGDAYDDILVPANNSFYILYGPSSGWDSITTISLPGLPTSIVCGDFNNDGNDDIAVGDEDGELNVVSGSSVEFTTAAIEDIADLTITGEGGISSGFTYDRWMTSGDLNGDGFDDIIAADVTNDSDGSNTGAVYVFYGDTLAQGVSSAVGVEITGSSSGSAFGYGLATGDLNGDGKFELLMRDPTDSANILVIPGSTARLTSGVYTASTDDLIQGVADSSFVETQITDVNADGLTDIVLGGKLSSGVNDSMQIVYGDNFLNVIDLTTSADVEIVDTSEVNSEFASRFAFGDMDHNGFVELYVTAYKANVDSTQDGRMYVYHSDTDNDSDGFNGSESLFVASQDCDDTDDQAHAMVTYYVDADGDTFGDPDSTTLVVCESTEVGSEYTLDNSDANDNDHDNDGVETEEDCDDSDETVSAFITYYIDADGDTVGDPATATTVCLVSIPEGFVDNGDDNDDTTTLELISDGIDNDNDDIIDEVNTGAHPDYTSYTTTADLNNASLFESSITRVRGSIDGTVRVRFADGATFSYPVFSITTETRTKTKRYGNTGYIVVLHPEGKRAALLNPYTGEVLKRVRLSRNIEFAKNSLKTLDVRHDDTLNVVVTSKVQGQVRVSVLNVNTTTSNLRKKDSILISDAEAVRVKKTKAPEQTIVLKNRRGRIIYTLDVNSEYQLSLR